MNSVIFTLALLLTPLAASAATLAGPIAPQCTGILGKVDFCNFCDLIHLFNNALAFAVAFSVIVATVMFVYAGFLYFSAAAHADNIKKAHGVFSKVLIGLIFVLAAWLIVDIISKTLVGNQQLGPWNQIQCVGIAGVGTPGTIPGLNYNLPSVGLPAGSVATGTPGTPTGVTNPNDNFSTGSDNVSCNPQLVQLVEVAHQYSSVPFIVNNCGRSGSSTATNSEHLCGTAVDVWPVVNGVPNPTGKSNTAPNQNYQAINDAFSKASQATGIPYRWGGGSSTFLQSSGGTYDAEHFDLGVPCSAPNSAFGGN